MGRAGVPPGQAGYFSDSAAALPVPPTLGAKLERRPLPLRRAKESDSIHASESANSGSSESANRLGACQ